MMKQVFLVLMMLNCVFVNAQKTSTISGTVTNLKDKTSIPNCVVNLKIDSIVTILTKTDSLGNYKFELTNPNFKKATLFLTTDKNLKTPTAKCAFLATDDVGQIIIPKDSCISYIKNFELSPVNHCGGEPPIILFRKNSADTISSYQYDYENQNRKVVFAIDQLKQLKKILNENPSIIIEMSCHCSSEEGNTEYADKLSQQRAEFIRAQLINLGINEKRIVPKGWGERKLKINDTQIKKAKTKEEKEALHSINRRCVFRILSWDFKE